MSIGVQRTSFKPSDNKEQGARIYCLSGIWSCNVYEVFPWAAELHWRYGIVNLYEMSLFRVYLEDRMR